MLWIWNSRLQLIISNSSINFIHKIIFYFIFCSKSIMFYMKWQIISSYPAIKYFHPNVLYFVLSAHCVSCLWILYMLEEHQVFVLYPFKAKKSWLANGLPCQSIFLFALYFCHLICSAEIISAGPALFYLIWVFCRCTCTGMELLDDFIRLSFQILWIDGNGAGWEG